MKFLSNLSKTKKVLLGLLVIVVVGALFYQLGRSSYKSKLESDLAAIDTRIGSGRASANELIELHLKKKAIIQQYLNSY